MSAKLSQSFNYNKGQRRAIWLLAVVILLLTLYRFYQSLKVDPNLNYDLMSLKIDSFLLDTDSAFNQKYIYNYQTESPKKSLRFFNPNLTSYETFIELGLKPHQAKSIIKYLSTGAQFEVKSDLRKIYTLSDGDYYRLEPYILLPEKMDKNAPSANLTMFIETEPIELNTADEANLQEIRGVGKVISKNIIKYRQMLGGFSSVEQLREVYGIDSLAFERISPQVYVNSDSILKMNINKISFKDLKKHPYITEQQAFDIINHIKYKGKFKSLTELKSLKSIKPSDYDKINPYFVVE